MKSMKALFDTLLSNNDINISNMASASNIAQSCDISVQYRNIENVQLGGQVNALSVTWVITLGGGGISTIGIREESSYK